MTPGLTAVNGLYGNLGGMQNYYNNPYFLQAFNSPNYNQMIAQQQMYAQQPINTTGQTLRQNDIQIPTGTNVNFQGAQSQITNEAKEEKKEKKGSNGLAWLLGIGATAIGTCWWLASRGKARNASGLWNQIKTGAVSLFKDSTILKGSDIVKHKDTLGINETLKWTDNAANLKGYQFELKNPKGILHRITVQNGQLTALSDLTQKTTKDNNLRNITAAYRDGKLDETFKKQIDDIIEMISSKNISNLSPDVNLKNIVYTGSVDLGGALYLTKATDVAKDGIKFVKTYANI